MLYVLFLLLWVWSIWIIPVWGGPLFFVKNEAAEKYSTLSNALKAARAGSTIVIGQSGSNGDTLRVEGKDNLELLITKDVTIQADHSLDVLLVFRTPEERSRKINDDSRSVIDYWTPLTISGATVTFEGLRITSEGTYSTPLYAKSGATLILKRTSFDGCSDTGAIVARSADVALEDFHLSNCRHLYLSPIMFTGTSVKKDFQVSHNSTFTDCYSAGIGGVIRAEHATVTVRNSYFSRNTANYDGGAIHISGRESSLLLEGSTLENNTVKNANGGAITVKNFARLSIKESSFTLNHAGKKFYFGGAIYAQDCPRVTISASTFRLNSAGSGGAIVVDKSDLYINTTKFTSNAAENTAGAILALPHLSEQRRVTPVFVIAGGVTRGNFCSNRNCLGGAVNSGVPVVIVTTRFEENTAGWSGGALYLPQLNMMMQELLMEDRIEDCTFKNNNALDSGGAIFSSRHKLVSLSNTFTGSVARRGSAIHCIAYGTKIINSRFVGSVSNRQGALFVTEHQQQPLIYTTIVSDFKLTNTTFLGNIVAESDATFEASSESCGGAVAYNATKISASISANTFLHNRAPCGGAISLQGGSGMSLAVNENHFENNTATMSKGGAVHIVNGDMIFSSSNSYFANICSRRTCSASVHVRTLLSNDSFFSTRGDTFAGGKPLELIFDNPGLDADGLQIFYQINSSTINFQADPYASEQPNVCNSKDRYVWVENCRTADFPTPRVYSAGQFASCNFCAESPNPCESCKLPEQYRVCSENPSNECPSQTPPIIGTLTSKLTSSPLTSSSTENPSAQLGDQVISRLILTVRKQTPRFAAALERSSVKTVLASLKGLTVLTFGDAADVDSILFSLSGRSLTRFMLRHVIGEFTDLTSLGGNVVSLNLTTLTGRTVTLSRDADGNYILGRSASVSDVIEEPNVLILVVRSLIPFNIKDIRSAAAMAHYFSSTLCLALILLVGGSAIDNSTSLR